MLTARRLLMVFVGALLLGGCSASSEDSKGFRITEPWLTTAPAPAADSPENALRLMEWCYANRNTAYYRTLFTADYHFVFGTLDPSGDPYRTTPWTRDDELAYFEHLVNGDAIHPPATRLTLLLDRNFRVTEDPQRSGPEHRVIRTSVTLRVVTEVSQYEVQGFANFFLTRGDAALVPLELGDHPDLWYIERWEDDTMAPDVARAMPSAELTWGGIKAMWR